MMKREYGSSSPFIWMEFLSIPSWIDEEGFPLCRELNGCKF